MYQFVQNYVIYPMGDVFDWKFLFENTLDYSILTLWPGDYGFLKGAMSGCLHLVRSKSFLVLLLVVNPFHFNVYN